MERRRTIWLLVTLVILLICNNIEGSPIIHHVHVTVTEKPEKSLTVHGKHIVTDIPPITLPTGTEPERNPVTEHPSDSPGNHLVQGEFSAAEKTGASLPAKFSATDKSAALQGKYFDEVMKELNQALKEKAAEEREHINLLLNMTAEMKELSEQVKGMQEKLKKIIGK